MDITSVFAFLYEMVYQLVDKVLTWFPDSPFQKLQFDGQQVDTWLGWLNWFVPVQDIMNIMIIWVGVIAIYYLIKPVAGWLKING